jgi:hypothetical protein
MKKIFFFTKEEAKEFLTKVSPEDLYNVFVKVRYFTFIACRTGYVLVPGSCR